MNNNLEAGEFNIELKEEEPVWMDKKRYTIFALPISFTTYYLTPTKILIESGLFTTREDEIMLTFDFLNLRGIILPPQFLHWELLHIYREGILCECSLSFVLRSH